jgi:formylglycine-generating enzyme required for sulfatase activity
MSEPESTCPDHRIERRGFLLGATGLMTGLLTGCREASTAASSASASASATVGATASAVGSTSGSAVAQAVAALVELAAEPSFSFTASLTNSGAGEAAAITRAYHLSTTLVTNAQYQQFVKTTAGSVPEYWSDGTPPEGKDDHPVLAVSLTDATEYCAWLSAQTSGWTFRLPTEAEWERAARGSRQASYPWGEESGTTYNAGVLTSKFTYNGMVSAMALAKYADQTTKYNDRSSLAGQSVTLSSILSVSADGGVQGWIEHDNNTGFVFTELFEKLAAEGGYTTAVGAHPDGATSDGLLDMAGNAFEWTSSVVTASNGAEAGKAVNAVRGGSWYATSRSCTTTYRGEGRAPTGRYSTVGFRVAADPV